MCSFQINKSSETVSVYQKREKHTSWCNLSWCQIPHITKASTGRLIGLTCFCLKSIISALALLWKNLISKVLKLHFGSYTLWEDHQLVTTSVVKLQIIVAIQAQQWIMRWFLKSQPATVAVPAEAEKLSDEERKIGCGVGGNGLLQRGWGREEGWGRDCCHSLQKLRPLSPPLTATKDTQSKAPKTTWINCLSYAETPIPESFLRQSVPIKMWVAVEKLKEKNFSKEQKRIKNQLEREKSSLLNSRVTVLEKTAGLLSSQHAQVFSV